MSRRARWDQIALSPRQIVISASLDILELHLYGHRGGIVLDAWHKSRGHDTGFALGLAVLHKILPVFSRLREPWQ
eukprot:1401175-Pyramimonas_sp.AAC.1